MPKGKNKYQGGSCMKNSEINTDRIFEFLEKYITTKFKNKLIILDNASSHSNERIKELVNKHNNILCAYFTNLIENYFSMLKITKVRWINTRKTKRKYRKGNM